MALPSLSWEMLYEIAEWTIRLAAVVVVPFRRKFTAAAWLLLIFFLPIPGLLLFLMIGQPRFPKGRIERFEQLRPAFNRIATSLRKHKPEQASPVSEFAEKLGYFPATAGNQIDLLDDYDATIDRLVADIEAATERVFILVYIFADDEVGCRVIDALGRAVERGVDCRVLLDPIGS